MLWTPAAEPEASKRQVLSVLIKGYRPVWTLDQYQKHLFTGAVTCSKILQDLGKFF
jgi:hypothetical protein